MSRPYDLASTSREQVARDRYRLAAEAGELRLAAVPLRSAWVSVSGSGRQCDSVKSNTSPRVCFAASAHEAHVVVPLKLHEPVVRAEKAADLGELGWMDGPAGSRSRSRTARVGRPAPCVQARTQRSASPRCDSRGMITENRMVGRTRSVVRRPGSRSRTRPLRIGAPGRSLVHPGLGVRAFRRNLLRQPERSPPRHALSRTVQLARRIGPTPRRVDCTAGATGGWPRRRELPSVARTRGRARCSARSRRAAALQRDLGRTRYAVVPVETAVPASEVGSRASGRGR